MQNTVRTFSMMQQQKSENAFYRAIRRVDWYYVLLAVALWCTFFCLHMITGRGMAEPTFYNTYTRQAMAWRSGSLHLPHDFPWLELAIYEGEYYVSFPPLPSVILLPLTFIFGENTPDNLLVKLYGIIACLAVYASLIEAGNRRPAAAVLAFLITVASSALPMMENGAVWYHAQMLAFMLMCLAVMFLLKNLPTGALLCYALSVACRPFDAVYGPLLFLVFFLRNRHLSFGKRCLKLLPGTILGLCVATGIGVFNYVRFGNPFEFGHNYLPEFSFQGGIQFSLSHVKNNIRTFLLSPPIYKEGDAYVFAQFGYSLLIACPTISLMRIHVLTDLFQRKFSVPKLSILLFATIQLFLLLMHRTFGGFQLGARYVVDLIPYTVLYLGLSDEDTPRNALFAVLLFAVFLLTLVGFTQVHI